MSLVELQPLLFLKAFLRVSPLFLFINMPLKLHFPVALKLFCALPLSLIVYGTLAPEATPSLQDLLLGVAVGAFVCLFLTSAMKLSLYFSPLSETHEDEEPGPWRDILDAVFLIFILFLFMALHLERNLLAVLGTSHETLINEKIFSMNNWSSLMTDLTWLALKLSSFGFLFVLLQQLFGEVYRRIGGEPLRIVFSLCAWIAIVVMSPLLLPTLAHFLNQELSEFWQRWMGSFL